MTVTSSQFASDSSLSWEKAALSDRHDLQLLVNILFYEEKKCWYCTLWCTMRNKAMAR
jgi:hypothetical protein